MAYKGIMDSTHLESLTDGHWIQILQESLLRGDICTVTEYNGTIVGTAVFGNGENE